MEIEIHSLAQLAFIKSLCQKRDLDVREALFIVNQLVNHGYYEAGDVLAALRLKLPPSASIFLDRLDDRHRVIQSLPWLSRIWNDNTYVENLLRTEGYLFLPGRERCDVCIVIFTSKYNNFHFSNIVLDAILTELGVSRLYLKDTSKFVYFKGVKDLADDFADLPEAIAGILDAQDIKRILVTGFSSGGYAALYAACWLTGADFIGFSTYTDISPDSKLHLPAFYNVIRDDVPSQHYQNLKYLVADKMATQKLRLYFGDRDPLDRVHARHFGDLGNVEIIEVPDGSHVVTSNLLERGQFQNLFASMLT